MRIEFDTDTDAFGPDSEYLDDLRFEVRRILDKICEQIDEGELFGTILDINGNRVGTWDLE